MAEFVDGPLDRFAAEGFVPNVAGNCQTAVFSFLDESLRFLGVVMLVEIDDHDVGAFLRHGHGYCPADSAVAAGDQGSAAKQAIGVLLWLCLRLGWRPHFRLQARPPVLMLARASCRRSV